MNSRISALTQSKQIRAVAALAASGIAWGTSVPLSKAALGWLSPGWLVAVRFGLAAAVLLVMVDKTALRRALRWPILAWGAVGLGGSILVQNVGLGQTSVTHAALLIGATPVLVAVVAALWRHNVARPLAWAGFLVSLAGVTVVAVGGGGGASDKGDALVLLSVLIAATLTVVQGQMLEDQDPAAFTAVQFLGAAIAAVPFAVFSGAPSMPAGGSGLIAVLAVVGLTLVGTVIPFTLFASGQHSVSTEVAGAFLNLEPLVGALIGVVAFSDPAGPRLAFGAAAIVGGILMSSLQVLHRHGDDRGRRRRSRLAPVH